MKTPKHMTDREQARLLYRQGLKMSEIATFLNIHYQNLINWKSRDKWEELEIFDDVELALRRRLLALIPLENKSNAQYKEIDNFMRQLERMAKINKYRETGNGGDLNPKLRERYKEDRKQKISNLFTDEDIQALEDAFENMLYPFQKKWVEILNGNKKHAPARIFMMLKSRQIGATYIVAIWSLINALKTKKNKIFLSASKAQAYSFIEYIKAFVFEVLDVQLKGDPITLTLSDNTQVNLYYMGTNALTAQGKHGDVIMDEFFWIRKFKEFRAVASGMASQSHYQQVYLSTPSSITHEAYSYWCGKDNVKKVEIDVSHKAISTPTLCKDKKWRQIITVKDAIKGGFDKLDVNQLVHEYTPERFDNLFMCQFIDDTNSYFPFGVLHPNMIDTWEVWKDFKPWGSNPYNGKVWVGYDPSFTGDYPALAVIAPALNEHKPYRLLERVHLDHLPPLEQSQHIKKICERYDVEFMCMDITGSGMAVAEHVKKFYPTLHEINYDVTNKTRMVLRIKELFTRRRFHFDAGYLGVAKAFIGIKQAMTNSQTKVTFVASRSKETGHSDIAWAIMHALEKAPLASTAVSSPLTKSQIKVSS